MRDITFPRLRFSRWYAWNRRDEYLHVHRPGVYIIYITKRPRLHLKKSDLYKASYIGMTVSKGGLRSRWRQFDRAVRGLGGHSGGNAIYKEKGNYKKWTESLYVAALSVDIRVSQPRPSDYREMGKAAYLEYDALARYFRRHGKLPPFNTKGQAG